MRILILANMDLGLYKFRRELLEELVKEYEVFFCVPNGDYVNKIKELGCKFIQCDAIDRRSTNPFKDIKLLIEYKRIIKEIAPVIVLTYTVKPNIYGGLICQLLKIPYIVNVTGLGTAIENGGILSFITTSLYRVGLRGAYCVFFQNSTNQSLFIRKKILKRRSRLIPGSGVNLDRYDLEPYPDESNGIHFLFVGRIMKDKGIEELLVAIREIHENRSDVVLDLVGPCEENYSKTIVEAESEGAIVNHGMQHDVHEFYKNCHCTILPSYHEGLANVLLESSAIGRPVIATRIPGCQETFDEGVTGLGCEVRDIESLKNSMNCFLSLSHKKRSEMGLAAREKMKNEFDRAIVIKAYKEEILKLCKQMRIK